MIIPIPTHIEYEAEPIEGQDYKWIQWYWNCPPWRCICGHTMFGRMPHCIHCKQPRPTEEFNATQSSI